MELVIDARRMLLGGLIDYAGMFPPASLDLESAVAEYRAARTGPQGWMLGRFLCPTSRIEDLAGALTQTMAVGETPWSIGAIFDEPAGSGALHAAVFDRHMDPAARVTAIELRAPAEAADGRKASDAADVLRPVATAASSVSPEAIVYLEIQRSVGWVAGLPAAIDGIASLRREMLRGFGAKLRTGGLDAGAFPTPEEVAAFIVACHDATLPLKATAGLHHPVRHWDAELGVSRHGFLNLLAAVSLAAEGASPDDVAAVVAEDDPDAFGASPAGLRWRDVRIGAATIRRVRQDAFPGYGSCSFDEPVADLARMGILEG
ncbi:MAG TPA: hypothetical protein VLG28_06905 [Acidimicrobiia bacterium]|nr:hypothetical protein [Acidimicrobiia bacterium]